MTPGSVQPGTGSARSKAPVATTSCRGRKVRARRPGRGPPTCSGSDAVQTAPSTNRTPAARARSISRRPPANCGSSGRDAATLLLEVLPTQGRPLVDQHHLGARLGGDGGGGEAAGAAADHQHLDIGSGAVDRRGAVAARREPGREALAAHGERAGRSWSCRRAGSGGRRSRPGSPGRRPCRRTARARALARLAGSVGDARPRSGRPPRSCRGRAAISLPSKVITARRSRAPAAAPSAAGRARRRARPSRRDRSSARRCAVTSATSSGVQGSFWPRSAPIRA